MSGSQSLAAALALLLAVALCVRNAPTDRTVIAHAALRASSGDSLAPATAAASASSAPKPAGLRSVWKSRFERSTDLRAFTFDARADAAHGGVFYVLRALAECRRRPLPDVWPGEPAADVRSHAELQRRAQRLDRAARRCAGFVDAELDDAAVAAIRADGLVAGDPLLGAYQQWAEALESGEYRQLEAALARALALRDPMLIEWIGATGSDYWAGSALQADAAGDTARRRALDAWRLLPCELGADCTIDDERAEAVCLTSGRCTGDRWQAVVADGGWQEGAAQIALATDLHFLARAVRTLDARALLGRVGAPLASIAAAALVAPERPSPFGQGADDVPAPGPIAGEPPT
jgi:hypothetical protein